MKSTYKPVWIILGALLVVAAGVILTRVFQPKEVVPWREGLAEGVRESYQAKKPMLLYFTAEWCGPCQTMRRTTWADPRVAQALERFVPVRIDIDQARSAAESYGVESIPAYRIVSPAGDTIKGADGGMAPEQFMAWLEGAAVPPAAPPSTSPETAPAAATAPVESGAAQ